MQPRSLLPYLLLALGVSAIPAHVKRDDTPNYVNGDGSIDFSALTADAAIVPTIVAPAQASNVILPIDTEAISEDVVSQAADQADTPAKRALLAKRASTPAWEGFGTCGAQTLFTQAKVSSPDTPDAFRADSSFAQAAKTAKKPSGYTLEYVALTGVYQSATSNSFLGVKTLTSAQGYNPQVCADYCNTNVKACLGFNIYYERDPPINLDTIKSDLLPRCNDPPSVTQIACMFYGSPVNAAAATSTGQVRGNYFRTAKAGSNGYSKATFVPPTLDGFNAPQTFGGKIDNQKVVGKIARTHLLTVNPDFNPQYCADVANKFYAGKYSSFETFMLKKNGAYVGQMCIVLTQTGFVPADANDAGQFGGRSPTYDETSVWYSSQPVYYYEVPATVTGDVVTFESDQYSDYQTLRGLSGIVGTSQNVDGFSFKVGNSDYYQMGAYIWSQSLYALSPKSGNYGTCQRYGTCILYAAASSDFTFDITSLDIADVFKTPGTLTLAGFRNGEQVASASFPSVGDWQTIVLPSSFSDLDQITATAPQVPAFDNIHIVKHLSGTKRRRSVVPSDPIVRRQDDPTFQATFANGTVVEAPTSCLLADLALGNCATTVVSSS